MKFIKFRTLIFIPIIVIVLTYIVPPKNSVALSGSDFQAGRIIDDVVFTNSLSMNTSEIQNFLNAQNPSCDTQGSQSISYYYDGNKVSLYPFNGGSYTTTTRAIYGQRYDNYYSTNIAGAPYVCLNQFVENPSTGQTNLQNPGASISGGESAAQIIYNAAQEYQINPQVIIVTIQKEQGLVTDDWPWMNEYQEALGYMCPDSPQGCSTTYADFYKQVDSAAWQFRQYLNSPDQFNYGLGQNQILYHYPQCMDSSGNAISCSSVNTTNGAVNCGVATVNIQNLSTAALYDYTPYTPDSAALSNVSASSSGGSGDICSAYGNRNFWWYFNTWFGSSLAPSYNAQIVNQSYYPTFEPGQSSSMYMQFKNTGNMPWYDDTSASSAGAPPVHLATDNPLNRSSIFSKSWPMSDRPDLTFNVVYNSDGSISSNQHVVLPGQIAEYWFALTSSFSTPSGQYEEAFRPVVEGVGPMNDTGSYFIVTLKPRSYQATFAGQGNYPVLNQGQTSSYYFEYKNTGSDTWYDDDSAPASEPPIHLSTDIPLNRPSIFSSGWLAPHRPANLFSAVYNTDGVTLSSNQHEVLPGQIGKFSFNLTVPLGLEAGNYIEPFRPVAEGYGPMNDTGTYVDIKVNALNYDAQAAGQSNYPTIQQGQSVSMYIKYKNIGTTTWFDDTSTNGNGSLPVHLATDNPLNRNSVFSGNWPMPDRPSLDFGRVLNNDGSLASNQHEVLPGQVGEFWFTLTANCNTAPGNYQESYRPVTEGYGPMNDTGTYFGVSVVKGSC